MRWLFALAIPALLSSQTAHATEKRLAVLDLVGEQVDTASLDYLTSQLRSESLRWMRPGWLMMGRPTGDVRSSGADQAVTGTVAWDGKLLQLRLRLIDAHTGAVQAHAKAVGPSLAALVAAMPPACRTLLAPRSRVDSAGPSFEFLSLPPLPLVVEPEEFESLDMAVLGTMDLLALEDLDRVAIFDRSGARASQKEGRWLDLAARRPMFAALATERAEQWRRYREEMDRSGELRRGRSPSRDRDWARLKRLLRISVIYSGDKVAWSRRFVEAYGDGPPENPYTGEIRRLLLASNPYLDFDDNPYEALDSP